MHDPSAWAISMGRKALCTAQHWPLCTAVEACTSRQCRGRGGLLSPQLLQHPHACRHVPAIHPAQAALPPPTFPARHLGILAQRKHCDAHRLAVAVGQLARAPHHLVALAGVHLELDGGLHGLIKLGTGRGLQGYVRGVGCEGVEWSWVGKGWRACNVAPLVALLLGASNAAQGRRGTAGSSWPCYVAAALPPAAALYAPMQRCWLQEGILTSCHMQRSLQRLPPQQQPTLTISSACISGTATFFCLPT
jgi:hypothetical protein